MFSASATMDRLKNRDGSLITIYHQTWAIRLLNERLNQETPVLDYGTLGSVVPLILYNIAALDRASAIAHQKGLIKMLLSTPKQLRDEIGPLLGLIKLVMLAVACVFDTPPVWDCLLSGSVRPNSILRNLVTGGIFCKNGYILEQATVDAILDVEIERVLSLKKRDDQSDRIQAMPAPLNKVDRVNACCQFSSLIFWKLLKGRAQIQAGTPATDIKEINLLLEHLMIIDSRYWIQNAPEALTWIVFTGVAASTGEKERELFIQIAGNLLAAVDSDSLVMIRQGWRFCSLLKRLAGFSLPVAISDGA
ncbi:hypothetical protein N7526_000631 [Penicillium atrosanguineum]|nr:hypothetical protein N7526_000631 [Penicillium atrosanguineum]